MTTSDMSRILVVDDDEGTRRSFSVALKLSGFDVSVADCGHKALALVRRVRPDVAFIDVNLPDISGVEVLRRMRQSGYATSIIMISAFATTRSTVEAMRLGAHNFIEKPINIDDLSGIIESAQRSKLRSQCSLRHTNVVTLHASVRLAEIIVRVIESPADPKTLSGWGRYVGASSGAIRNWCATMHMRSKQVLDFARLLRAVIRQQDGYRAEDLLDVVDRRTLQHLLTLGQCGCKRRQLPDSVDEFVRAQRLVTNVGVIEEVRKRLVSRDIHAG